MVVVVVIVVIVVLVDVKVVVKAVLLVVVSVESIAVRLFEQVNLNKHIIKYHHEKIIRFYLNRKVQRVGSKN